MVLVLLKHNAKNTKVLQLHFAKIAILVIFNVKGLSQKRVRAISKRGACQLFVFCLILEPFQDYFYC